MSYITGDMITENPKPTTVIICGISKKQDGTYYCPYCSFESEEIEDFATSMCWDCALADDEEVNEEESMNLKDIRVNDIVRISKEVTVGTVGVSGFTDTRGKFYSNAGEPGIQDGFTVELVRREPEGFPIQIGDIWLADDGKEWYIFSVGSISGNGPHRAMTTPHDGGSATNLSIEEFKPKAVKLMHRREFG